VLGQACLEPQLPQPLTQLRCDLEPVFFPGHEPEMLRTIIIENPQFVNTTSCPMGAYASEPKTTPLVPQVVW
jgi:hypothetical protein